MPKPKKVNAGDCQVCGHGALLYEAFNRGGQIVLICWECREKVRLAHMAQRQTVMPS